MLFQHFCQSGISLILPDRSFWDCVIAMLQSSSPGDGIRDSLAPWSSAVVALSWHSVGEREYHNNRKQRLTVKGLVLPTALLRTPGASGSLCRRAHRTHAEIKRSCDYIENSRNGSCRVSWIPARDAELRAMLAGSANSRSPAKVWCSKHQRVTAKHWSYCMWGQLPVSNSSFQQRILD